MVRQSEDVNKRLSAYTESRQPVLKLLHRQWWGFVFAAVLIVVAGYLSLRAVWNPIYTLRWGAIASLISTYEIVMLRSALHLNHRPGEGTLLPTLGPANWLSLARGLMLAVIGGFLFSPWPEGWLAWICPALYLAVMFIDFGDGIIARVTNHMTLLGERLDIEMDALGILIVPLLGVLYGQLPVAYLLVSAARYLFMGGMWLLKRQGKPIHELTPSHQRRVLAGFQMGMIPFLIAPVFSPLGTWIVAMVFALPLLAGFVRDWFVVSGAVDPASEEYIRSIYRSEIIFRQWLPVALRTLVTLWGVIIGMQFLRSGEPGHIWVGLGFLACTLLTVLGIAARVSTGLTLLLIGFFLPVEPLSTIAVVTSCATILILGSGRLSLWKPEEIPMDRRYGSKEEKEE